MSTDAFCTARKIHVIPCCLDAPASLRMETNYAGQVNHLVPTCTTSVCPVSPLHTSSYVGFSHDPCMQCVIPVFKGVPTNETCELRGMPQCSTIAASCPPLAQIMKSLRYGKPAALSY